MEHCRQDKTLDYGISKIQREYNLRLKTTRTRLGISEIDLRYKDLRPLLSKKHKSFVYFIHRLTIRTPSKNQFINVFLSLSSSLSTLLLPFPSPSVFYFLLSYTDKDFVVSDHVTNKFLSTVFVRTDYISL